MKMTMRELTVDLETVTPLFLGGASQDEPEARAASFRGALRFWWRALAAEPDLDELRRREAAVFGDTGRASAVRVDVETVRQVQPLGWRAARSIPRVAIDAEASLGLDYLGFSLRQMRQRPERVCFPSGTKLRLRLRLRRGADESALREAGAALWLLVNLGGLGTRARRGFGSLEVTSTAQLGGLPPWQPGGERPGHAVKHLNDGLMQLRRFVKHTGAENQVVEYPILAPRHSVVVVLFATSQTWQAALEARPERGTTGAGWRPGRMKATVR